MTAGAKMSQRFFWRGLVASVAGRRGGRHRAAAMWTVALVVGCAPEAAPPRADWPAASSRIRLFDHLADSEVGLSALPPVTVPPTLRKATTEGQAFVQLELPWNVDPTGEIPEILIGPSLWQFAGQKTLLRAKLRVEAEAMRRTDDASLRNARTLASRIALPSGSSLHAPLPPIPDGAQATLVVRAEAGNVTVQIRRAGKQITAWQPNADWLPHEFEVPPAWSEQELEIRCQVEGANPSDAHLVVKRLDLTLGKADQLLLAIDDSQQAAELEQAAREDQLRVRYLPQAPPPQWQPEGDDSPIYLRKGEVVVRNPASEFALTGFPEGESLTSQETENGRTFRVERPGLYRLEGAGAAEVLQPEALRSAVLLDSEFVGAPESEDAWLERRNFDHERRLCRTLSPNHELRTSVPAGSPGTLRFGSAMWSAGPSPVSSSLEIWWTPTGGEAQRLGEISSSDSGTHWTDHGFELPSSDRGGALAFRLNGESYALGEAGLSLPFAAVANPTLVDPADLPGGIIVYLIDTLRADHMSIYGYERDTTPVLESLEHEMVIFDHAYSSCSWTRPATASLLTGLHPTFHGAYGQKILPEDVETLAERCRAAGYATGAVVANPNVSNPGLGFDQGFEEFLQAFVAGGELFHTYSSAYQSWITDWLDRHQNEPFLLYIQSIDPHSPYTPPEKEWRRYDPDYAGPIHGLNEGEFGFENMLDPSEEDVAHVRALYDAEIRINDRSIGELIEDLRQRGLWDRSGFLLTSDHGEEFLDHGGWQHGGRMFEEQVHIPLMLKPAAAWNLNPGRLTHRVQLPDVVPTLRGLMDLPGDELFSGVDLGPWMRGEESNDPDRVLYFDEPPLVHALVQGPLKLIVYRERDQQRSLFHLSQDPEETENRVTSELKRADALQHNMAEFVQRYEALGLVPREGKGRIAVLDEAAVDQLMAIGYLK